MATCDVAKYFISRECSDNAISANPEQQMETWMLMTLSGHFSFSFFQKNNDFSIFIVFRSDLNSHRRGYSSWSELPRSRYRTGQVLAKSTI